MKNFENIPLYNIRQVCQMENGNECGSELEDGITFADIIEDAKKSFEKGFDYGFKTGVVKFESMWYSFKTDPEDDWEDEITVNFWANDIDNYEATQGGW